MGVFVPFLIGSHMLIAVAVGAPSLNVTQTCRATGSITGSAPSQDDIDACVRDEQEARDAVEKEWGEFGADSRTRCVRASKDYLPSYVELQACLEMARDAASSPEETQPKTERSSVSPPQRERSSRRHLRHRNRNSCLPWDYACTFRYGDYDFTRGY
jgi:hypothetical protein